MSVGLPDALAQAFAGARQINHFHLSDITPEAMRVLGVAMVACPLMGKEADALCVIAALDLAGFTGTLTVISPRLPDAAMVERELRAASRGVRVNLITL